MLPSAAASLPMPPAVVVIIVRRAFVTVSLLATAAACTYEPAKTSVLRANSAPRGPASDSFALALSGARISQATGIAAFPDGGRARIRDEHAFVYLCVAAPASAPGSPPRVRRLAAVERPARMVVGFEPWIMGWDDDGGVRLRMTGYAGQQHENPRLHVAVRVSLDGTAQLRAAEWPPVTGPSVQLPAGCEDAAGDDARAWLDARGG